MTFRCVRSNNARCLTFTYMFGVRPTKSCTQCVAQPDVCDVRDVRRLRGAPKLEYRGASQHVFRDFSQHAQLDTRTCHARVSLSPMTTTTTMFHVLHILFTFIFLSFRVSVTLIRAVKSSSASSSSSSSLLPSTSFV